MVGSANAGDAQPSPHGAPAAVRSSTEIETIVHTWRLADKERWPSVLVIVLGLLASGLEGVSLALFVPLIQILTGHQPALPLGLLERGPAMAASDAGDQKQVLVLTIVGLLVASAVVNYVSMAYSSRLSLSFAHRLRGRIVRAVSSEPVWQVEASGSGELANSILGESWRACDALFAVLTAIIEACACALFITILVGFSGEYTAYLLLLTGLSALCVQLATRRLRRLSAASLASNEAYTLRVMEFIEALRVVRAYGREVFEERRFDRDGRRLTTVFVRMALVGGLVAPLTRIMALVTVGSLVMLAVARGDDLATLVGFLAVAYRMQPRVSAIIGQRAKLAGVSASVAALATTLSQRADPLREGGERYTGLKHEIVFERVDFTYPHASRPVLEDVSCRFRKGELAAVAGYSGAGKSTLVGLLLNFGHPERGAILVDGRPLARLCRADWHARLAFVAQDAAIFAGTVRENIAYGRLDADQGAIENAAREARAHDFIQQLPQGYDTVVGETGSRLSSGQRQRLALARAIVRDPDVLVLDEATSALDEPTERAIRKAIDRWRHDRLVIVIAHRRSTIEGADHVVVLHGGRVVDQGSPTVLAGRSQVFDELYRQRSTPNRT